MPMRLRETSPTPLMLSSLSHGTPRAAGSSGTTPRAPLSHPRVEDVRMRLPNSPSPVTMEDEAQGLDLLRFATDRPSPTTFEDEDAPLRHRPQARRLSGLSAQPAAGTPANRLSLDANRLALDAHRLSGGGTHPRLGSQLGAMSQLSQLDILMGISPRMAGERTDASAARRGPQSDSDLRDKELLYIKWLKRRALTQWRRRFFTTNRTILQRLYRSSKFAKGKSAQLRRALTCWVEVVDMLKLREIKRLQLVADKRLEMLFMNIAGPGGDVLKTTRNVALRWKQRLIYNVFWAWCSLCALSHTPPLASIPPPAPQCCLDSKLSLGLSACGWQRPRRRLVRPLARRLLQVLQVQAWRIGQSRLARDPSQGVRSQDVV